MTTFGNYPPTRINLLHMSDTHGCHRQIEERFGPIPEDTNVILHTGDMTRSGRDDELEDFNAWCGELKARMPQLEIICVTGNHELSGPTTTFGKGDDDTINPQTLLDASYFQERMPNCKVLSHSETIQLPNFGVTIHGCSWVPWWTARKPGVKPNMNDPKSVTKARFYKKLVLDAGNGGTTIENYFGYIPVDVDVLLVHCPPYQILDCLEGSLSSWGANKGLLEQLYVSRPKCVLWGHLHENRGWWMKVPTTQSVAATPKSPATRKEQRQEKSKQREESKKPPSPWSTAASSSVDKTNDPATAFEFVGGCEYYRKGKPVPTIPPPDDLPVQVLSNAALLNHRGMDQKPAQITGRPRRIVGTRPSAQCDWSFAVEVLAPVYFFPVQDESCDH